MKLLNITSALLAFVVLALFSAGAQATVVNSAADTNDDIVCRGARDSTYVQNCWTGTGSDPLSDFDLNVPDFNSMDLLYRADFQNPSNITESGTLIDSYSTVFIKRNGRVEDAEITFDSPGPSIDCLSLSNPCFLLVAGDVDPTYLFNLALGWDPDYPDGPGGWSVDAIPSGGWNGVLPSWDGISDLLLYNFGRGNLNNISHVALYGKISAVPVPAAFWLFGTALLGFIGLSRKTSI